MGRIFRRMKPPLLELYCCCSRMRRRRSGTTASVSVSPHCFFYSLFCLQSSTRSTPLSSFASPATSAPRTTGPARDAGFDALLQAAGGYDDDDDDALGSADIVSNRDSVLALLIAAAAVTLLLAALLLAL